MDDYISTEPCHYGCFCARQQDIDLKHNKIAQDENTPILRTRYRFPCVPSEYDEPTSQQLADLPNSKEH